MQKILGQQSNTKFFSLSGDVSFSEMTEKGNYEDPELYNRIHCYFKAPRSDKQAKFAVFIESDRGNVTFMSDSIEKIERLIAELVETWTRMMKEKIKDPDVMKAHPDIIESKLSHLLQNMKETVQKTKHSFG